MQALADMRRLGTAASALHLGSYFWVTAQHGDCWCTAETLLARALTLYTWRHVCVDELKCLSLLCDWSTCGGAGPVVLQGKVYTLRVASKAANIAGNPAWYQAINKIVESFQVLV